MKFTAVDIECDQPGDEIIQIGAAAFDTDVGDTPYSVFDSFPDIGRPINWTHQLRNGKGTLGDLIPWGQDYYDSAKSKKKLAYIQFWDWFRDNGAGKKIIQWGNLNGDVAHIKRHTPHEILIPNYSTFDLKSTYKFLVQPVMRLPKGHGLGSATNALGVEWVGEPHDALNDSIATGSVYIEIIKILDQYRKMKELMK